MALTYRFYRSPRIGTGTLHDAYRADLVRFIDGSGGSFAQWWAPPPSWRPVFYSLAYCDSAAHAAVDADATSTALSSELADQAAIDDFLDNHTALNLAQAVLTQFDNDGISTAWLSSNNTNRHLFNYGGRLMNLLLDVQRVANTDTISAFAQSLGTRVNQLTQAVRTKVSTWMTNKGLDTAWITGTTTVRQVVQYVLENISWPAAPMGPATF